MLTFDYQSIIDIGFVGFVTLACFLSLTRDGSSGEGRRERWRAELKDLEESLKGLIREASQASSSLDRSLLQRKRELENILRKLEEKESQIGQLGSVSAANDPSLADDELPNSSWVRGIDTGAAESSSSYESGYSDFGSVGDTSGLESLIAAADDTVSISNNISKSVAHARKDQTKLPGKKQAAAGFKGLAKEIEVIKEEQELENATFEMTSIMDRGTFRIARRLLSEGKELDIVARKLELPVSEVRLLERLMRKEQAPEQIAEVAPQEIRHVVRERKPVRKPSLRGGIASSGIESDIEREIALL